MELERIDQPYSLDKIKDVLTEAGGYAFLPITLFSVCYNAIECFATAWIYKDDIQDKSGCTFQVIPANFEALADLWLARKVTFLGSASDTNAIDRFKKDLKEVFRESLKKQYAIIQELKNKTGVQADFYIEIEANSASNNKHSPYKAIGSRLGGNTPIILFTPLQLNIGLMPDSTKSIDSFIDYIRNQIRASEQVKKFAIAHEFSHLKHEDPLKRWRMGVICDVCTIAVWALGFYASSSWKGRLLGSYLVSTVVQAIGVIAQARFFKKQEFRADAEAVKTIGSKTGAVQLFLDLSKVSSDLFHPTSEERLRNIESASA